MKHFKFLCVLGVSILIAVSAWADIPRQINFQGVLTDGSGLRIANGTVAVEFRIYDAAAGGAVQWTETHTLTTNADGVVDAVLGSSVPIPETVFDGASTWLGLTVGGDPEMSPRQQLVSAAYAYKAKTAETATGGLTNGWVDDGSAVRLETGTDLVGIGTATPAEKLDVDGNVLVSGTATIGTGHTNTGVAGFIAGASNTATGDYGVVSGGDSNKVTGTHGSIGGGYNNWAQNDGTVAGGLNNWATGGATVGGGSGNQASGGAATIGGGNDNIASAALATVGGGQSNEATGVNHATIAGGVQNKATADRSTVGGGHGNEANGAFSVVTGGNFNKAIGSVSTVGGGDQNQAVGNYAVVAGGGGGGFGKRNQAAGAVSTVGGGAQNIASGDSSTVGGGGGNTASGKYATVPGGVGNSASADYAMAAGWNASAGHANAFVWNDGSAGPFASSGANQFLIHAAGGVGIGTSSPDQLLSVNGNASKVGGGSWATYSDRRLKIIHSKFTRGLDDIIRLEPVTYRYKADNPLGVVDEKEHVGLIAQEVQELIPEAVTENAEGYLMVDNDPIIWAMLNAIKTQQTTIEELQTQIATLQKLIDVNTFGSLDGTGESVRVAEKQ